MRKSICLICTVVIFNFLVSCLPSIRTEDLYGEWRYIKVESPNQNPPYVMPEFELADVQPSIKFLKTGELIMIWDGKQLSHGKFRVEGNLIRYTEALPDGTSRQFPFLISKLNDKEIVFETMEQDATRISARRID